MIRPAVDDVALNAYVDGELPPSQAAAIAQKAARDPELAARIARLHRLKAALAGIAEREPMARPRRRRRALRWTSALALAGCLALAVGAAALMRPAAPAPPAEVALHDAWAESGAREVAEAPVWLTSVIEATGLSLARVAPVRSHDGPPGVHYAFVGTNECRLSLFEMPAAAGTDSLLTLLVQGNLRSARWQAGGNGYLVIARNMDGARFATIVAALKEATISRTAPEAERIALLQAARQRCLT